MKPPIVGPAFPPDALNVRRGFDPSALAALFILTLRQHLRGRRLLVLSLLFLLPSVLALVVKLTPFPPTPEQMEFVFVFHLIPHALATLAALLYAAGIVPDEVEEQTLTYLLVRPLPRWAIYLTKLVTTWIVTSALTAVFTTLALAVIYWDTPQLWGDVLPVRAAKIAALMVLAQAGYCSLFGFIGLSIQRPLIVGLFYIIAFEGLLANFESVIRRLTVMYYFRVLSARWLDLKESKEWSLNLATAPSAGECVLVLLGVSAALALCGAALMAQREFRMKTPEGS